MKSKRFPLITWNKKILEMMMISPAQLQLVRKQIYLKYLDPWTVSCPDTVFTNYAITISALILTFVIILIIVWNQLLGNKTISSYTNNQNYLKSQYMLQFLSLLNFTNYFNRFFLQFVDSMIYAYFLYLIIKKRMAQSFDPFRHFWPNLIQITVFPHFWPLCLITSLCYRTNW